MTAKCLLIECWRWEREDRKKERQTHIVNLLVNEAIILPNLDKQWQTSQTWVGLVLARVRAWDFQPGIIMLKTSPHKTGLAGRGWIRQTENREGGNVHRHCINWEDTCLIMGHCAVYLPHKGFTVDPQIAAVAERLCYIPMIQGQKNTVGSLIFMQLYYIWLLTCLNGLSQTYSRALLANLRMF